MDKVVLDIETKNTFQEVGGRELDKLEVSFVGAYSYNRDQYLSFYEDEMAKLGELLKKTGLLIGFAINYFDVPVLDRYLDFNLRAIPRLDLLEEFELAAGFRISLNILAKSNLGEGKSHASGLMAIQLYREGKLEELKEYCLQDVKLTKDLYDLIRARQYVYIPDRFTNQPIKVPMAISEDVLPATLF